MTAGANPLPAVAADEVLVDGVGADRLELRLASYEATLHAVRTWHYSASPPSGKLVRIGVWHGPEGATRFLGVVIFSRGASPKLYQSFRMPPTELCELTRVALRDHPGVHVSRILGLALRFLRATNPDLKLVVSFADPHEGHHGGIYQATNWMYYGVSAVTLYYIVNGRKVHVRTAGAWYSAWQAEHPEVVDVPHRLDWIRQHKDPGATFVSAAGKHRYLFPLDRATRKRFAHLSLPYPTRESTAEHAAVPAMTGARQSARVVGAALARFRELTAAGASS